MISSWFWQAFNQGGGHPWPSPRSAQRASLPLINSPLPRLQIPPTPMDMNAFVSDAHLDRTITCTVVSNNEIDLLKRPTVPQPGLWYHDQVYGTMTRSTVPRPGLRYCDVVSSLSRAVDAGAELTAPDPVTTCRWYFLRQRQISPSCTTTSAGWTCERTNCIV